MKFGFFMKRVGEILSLLRKKEWCFDFPSSKLPRPAPRPTQPSNQMVLGAAVCSGVRRLGHQADNLPPSTEWVKHEWRYLSTYPI
jgi:hypothetical protein